MNNRCFSFRSLLLFLIIFLGPQTVTHAGRTKQQPVKEVVRLLGFDPKYKNLPTDADRGKSMVIFLSGHNGLDPNPIRKIDGINGIKVITFDFGNLHDGRHHISQESVGGSFDAQAALYPVIKCVEMGCPVIINGLSRGGGAAVTLMHMIEFPNKYRKIWKKFGFVKSDGFCGMTLDHDRIEQLKKNIQKVYLNNSILKLSQALGPIEAFVYRVFGPLVTKMDWREPYSRIKELPGKGWNVEIGVSRNDVQFGSNTCEEFLDDLCETDDKWAFHHENKHHLDYQTSIDSIIGEIANA